MKQKNPEVLENIKVPQGLINFFVIIIGILLLFFLPNIFRLLIIFYLIWRWNNVERRLENLEKKRPKQNKRK